MFVTAGMLSAERPSADDDFWYQPVGAVSASGARVGPDAAMRLSVVLACVRVLSEAVAKVPFGLMRGVAQPASGHPLDRVLRRRPNAWQSPFEFREMLQAHLCLRSNAYAQIVYGQAGEILALVPLHPDRVKLEQVSDADLRYLVTDWRGQERALASSEVFHLRALSMDGFAGLSIVDTMREPIGNALVAQDYAGRFLRNGARHAGMWVEVPGQFKDAAAHTEFQQRFRAGLSGGSAYSTPVLDRGMKLHELGMTNEDAQFLESRKYSDADLCRMFLVPPHLVGILDRATFSNIEQQSHDFYNSVVMALFRRWEEAVETQLLLDVEAVELRAEFDVRQLLRGDSQARSNYYHAAIADGWMTRNEVRLAESMEPLEGLDEPLAPLNMGRTQPSGKPEPQPPGQNPAPRRAEAMMLAAADRAVTRECNAIERVVARGGSDMAEQIISVYETHAPWLAKVLAVDQATADRICTVRFDELRASKSIGDTLADWRALGGHEILRIADDE